MYRYSFTYYIWYVILYCTYSSLVPIYYDKLAFIESMVWPVQTR